MSSCILYMLTKKFIAKNSCDTFYNGTPFPPNVTNEYWCKQNDY